MAGGGQMFTTLAQNCAAVSTEQEERWAAEGDDDTAQGREAHAPPAPASRLQPAAATPPFHSSSPILTLRDSRHWAPGEHGPRPPVCAEALRVRPPAWSRLFPLGACAGGEGAPCAFRHSPGSRPDSERLLLPA